MKYFYYTDLLQPSNDTDEDKNFEESLNKENGYYFNELVNLLHDSNLEYTVIEGFDYQSEDELICNFKKITFSFDKNIDSFINENQLDGKYIIVKDNSNYTFTIKE